MGRLQDEFLAQGDAEMARSMTPLPFMDRKQAKGGEALGKQQLVDACC